MISIPLLLFEENAFENQYLDVWKSQILRQFSFQVTIFITVYEQELISSEKGLFLFTTAN